MAKLRAAGNLIKWWRRKYEKRKRQAACTKYGAAAMPGLKLSWHALKAAAGESWRWHQLKMRRPAMISK